MIAAYRNDEDAAQLRLEALLQEQRAKLDAIIEPFRQVYVQRFARAAAGGAALGCAGLIAGLTVFAMCTGQVTTFWRSGGAAGLLGHGALLLSLIASWAVVTGAYLAASRLAPGKLHRELERAFQLSGDARADYDRLRAALPRARLRHIVDAVERPGAALPLAGLMALAPLSIHLVVYFLALALSGADVGRRLEDFDGWVALSLVLVGHVHAVLAYLAFRYMGQLCQLSTHELREASPRGFRALGIAALVSLLPGGILYLVPPLLTGATGLLFVPWSFSAARRRLLAERKLLERQRPLTSTEEPCLV